MMGGTDHDCETYRGRSTAERMLDYLLSWGFDVRGLEAARDRLADARYGVRAWSQGISWFVVLGGLGTALTGWAQHDTAMLASGVTAVVVAFVPRARPFWIAEVVKTVAMKRGWTAVPAEERPLRSPDEILSGTTMKPESTGYTGHEIASRERLRPADVRREEASGRSVGVSDSVAEVRRIDEA